MSCRQNKGLHYSCLFWQCRGITWRVYLKADSLGCETHPTALEWDLGFPFYKGFLGSWPAGGVGTRLWTSNFGHWDDLSLLSNQPLIENHLSWFLFAELNSWLGIAVSCTLSTCIRSPVLRITVTQKCTQAPMPVDPEEIHGIIFQLSSKFCNYQYSFHVLWESA